MNPQANEVQDVVTVLLSRAGSEWSRPVLTAGLWRCLAEMYAVRGINSGLEPADIRALIHESARVAGDVAADLMQLQIEAAAAVDRQQDERAA
jgi:hypothetical protein